MLDLHLWECKFCCEGFDHIDDAQEHVRTAHPAEYAEIVNDA